jgi:hypothetical protein
VVCFAVLRADLHAADRSSGPDPAEAKRILTRGCIWFGFPIQEGGAFGHNNHPPPCH